MSQRAGGWWWRRRLGTRSLVLSGALAGACLPLPEASQPVAAALTRPNPEGPIIILGDTQRTLFAERLLWREQNDAARTQLIQTIADRSDHGERPAFVVHLGDMVAWGESTQHWQYFERLVSPLSVRKIEILPVLGNHDYWVHREEALAQAQAHFAQLKSATYYARSYRGLELLFLDTNLDGRAARCQTRWFEDALEKHSGARGILVFGHHPAYTNGEGRHGEPYVVSELVPRFLAAKNTVAFFSGHVHGYERFSVLGKAFVVSGGGGGPRVCYRTGSAASTEPAYQAPSSGRSAFHYVQLSDHGSELRLAVRCIPDAVAACEQGVLEEFSLPLPPLAAPLPPAPPPVEAPPQCPAR